MDIDDTQVDTLDTPEEKPQYRVVIEYDRIDFIKSMTVQKRQPYTTPQTTEDWLKTFLEDRIISLLKKVLPGWF